MSRIKTQFHGLTIVHPHSGKVSRSVVATLIKHQANGYLGQSDKQNAEYIAKWEGSTVVLEDVNYQIKISHVTPFETNY